MKNRKITYVLVFILGFVLVGALVKGFNISHEISISTKNEYLWESEEVADYHVMVILDEQNQEYGDDFEHSLDEVSEKYKIAVEIIKIDRFNYNEDVLDALDMAMYLKVDGIIVHASLNNSLIEKIKTIQDRGIPVITLNQDLEKSSRMSFVGVNRYNIGQVAGQIFAKSMNGSGKIAVIEQKGYEIEGHSSEDMLLLGLTDVLKAYKNLNLELVRYTEQGVLSAETVATKIFKENPDITGVFCADGQNTLGVVQVLIDNNLVNDIALVGYGSDYEIFDYLQKSKIIEAVIVNEYEDVARLALNAFYEYKNGLSVSNYIDIDLRVVDKENIDTYLSEKSDNYDKTK